VARVVAILYLEFRGNVLLLRASALTFSVVLSLVPIIALGTAVLKGLGAEDQIRAAAYRFVDQFTFQEFVEEKPAAPEPDGAKTLATHLRTAVDKVLDYVERTNFATLGAFGILGMVVTVVSVLSNIEQAMNVIWRAERGRALGQRIMDYLALMILLPVVINFGFTGLAALQSPTVRGWLEVVLPAAWADIGLRLLAQVPLILVVFTFIFFYRFLPNTPVKWRPAVIGGLVGGINWLLIQALYLWLQVGVARNNAIYGSFATVPLVLLWIYFAWVVFLTGAETAFAVQVWRTYNPRPRGISPSRRLAAALDIMNQLQLDFRQRQVTAREVLVKKLQLSEDDLDAAMAQLTAGGFVHQVQETPEGYVPGTPFEEQVPGQIVELIYGGALPDSPGGRITKAALLAAQSAANERAGWEARETGICRPAPPATGNTIPTQDKGAE